MLKTLTTYTALCASLALTALPALGQELTAAHVNPPGEPSNEAFAELSKRLENSETGLSLKVFPQGQVGGEKDAIEQVKLGAITMTTVANSNLASFAPSVGVFDIPFLFRNATDHPRAVAEGDVGEDIAERVLEESGLEVLGWWSAGLRHVITRNKDVSTPADMEGMKTRVIGSPVYIDTFNALGAQATPMPYGEVYTALATGTIDAAENDSSGYRNMGFWEQAPHYSLTGHFFLYKPVVANKSMMDNLSEEQREEFDRVFAEVTDFQWDLFANNFEENIEFLESKGVTVTEPDRAAFRDEVQGVVAEYTEKYGEDLVQRIRDAK
ncbi:MAG: TRAP transporter substrate-binding protein [Silicimonas sp.]